MLLVGDLGGYFLGCVYFLGRVLFVASVHWFICGLLVAWDINVVYVVELAKDQFCISVCIRSVRDNTSFYLTTVYAPCDDSVRPIFSQTLDQIVSIVEGPCILLGDFNMYRFGHEKSRGHKNWAVMESFNNWIRDNAMDDIDVSNQ